MKKYAIPSVAYKNQLFSKAVQNKYNILRLKHLDKQTPIRRPLKTNFVAG